VKNFFLLTMLLTTALIARDNPFKVGQKEDISGAAMCEINKVDKLQSIGITPPVESVKIKKITIEYQSVDGQRIKKTYDVEKGIDPLKCLKITQ
jgi:hypothetical protein